MKVKSSIYPADALLTSNQSIPLLYKKRATGITYRVVETPTHIKFVYESSKDIDLTVTLKLEGLKMDESEWRLVMNTD